VLNHEKVSEAIRIICDWSYAHRISNGIYSDREQNKIVERHVVRMKEYI